MVVAWLALRLVVDEPVSWNLTTWLATAAPEEVVTFAVSVAVCPASRFVFELDSVSICVLGSCQATVNAVEAVPEKVVKLWPAQDCSVRFVIPEEFVRPLTVP